MIFNIRIQLSLFLGWPMCVSYIEQQSNYKVRPEMELLVTYTVTSVHGNWKLGNFYWIYPTMPQVERPTYHGILVYCDVLRRCDCHFMLGSKLSSQWKLKSRVLGCHKEEKQVPSVWLRAYWLQHKQFTQRCPEGTVLRSPIFFGSVCSSLFPLYIRHTWIFLYSHSIGIVCMVYIHHKSHTSEHSKSCC